MVETTTILPGLLPGSGGAVLATRAGRPVLRAAGVADAATGQPLTPDPVFRLCSTALLGRYPETLEVAR
ncbi:MAG TPA: serine hydrolase [Actinospica sp.]|jgi:CubicO group peptidase (beta-lactamase class C family)|nr:serine hydrolase [Actinospica sp.]